MKRILLIFVALSIAATAFCQTSIKVQAPNLVALDEQFNVTFIISGENAPSSFDWNAGDDFQLVWGPQKGTSTSLTIVNGQRTKTSQTTFTYVLLPKQAGKFQLAPATATVKGEQVTSGRHGIEVVSGGTSQSGQSQPQGRQEGSQSQAGSTGTVSNEDIFLRLTLSKNRAVVGETISATLKLYQRVNIAGFEDAKFPTFNGFWSQEVMAPTNIEFQRENVGNVIYNSAILRSWTLIPQQAGEIKIEPAELVCLVNVRAPSSGMGSIFDSFFQDDYQTIRKRVTSKAFTVQVSPVPAGAPASFGGGVGSFRMSTALSRDSLQTHDAASLKVTISGKGNVALLEAPKVVFPADFEVYDVKVTESAASKTFEYPFIPRSHGEFVIPAVEYSYYDVAAGKYVTLTGEDMPVSVSRGSETASAGTSGQLEQLSNRKDVKSLGSDIRYISAAVPAMHPSGRMFAGSTLFWILAAFLLLVASGLYLSLRNIAKRRADVVMTRKRAATKMARRRLSNAGDYLGKNLYSAFYEELHKALLGYVSDKLGMDAADMSKDNMASGLSEKGVPEGVVADFVGLLDACEFARYSPDAGHEAMNTHFESAVSVISIMDECMKKYRKPSSGTVAALILMLLLPFPAALYAEESFPADSLWNAGVEAYGNGNWDEALGCWNGIVESGLQSSELSYNIGNAYFKQGDVAHAIVSYERALRLDPSNRDAAFNLEFANARTQDKIEAVPEFFLKTWFRNTGRALSADSWGILFLVLLGCSLAAFLLFLLGTSTGSRKTGFFSSIALLIICMLCLVFSLNGRSAIQRADEAVVVRAVSSVRSSPARESSVDLFVLHEGTKVLIMDSVGEWVNIELADGRQGWIKAADIEII